MVDGVALVSEPLKIVVNELNHPLINISTGFKINKQRSDGEAVFVQQSSTANIIYRYQFFETLHAGEVGKRASSSLFERTENIEQIFVPETDTKALNGLSRWVVWRDKNTVSALSDLQRTPIKWSAPLSIGALMYSRVGSKKQRLDLVIKNDNGDALKLQGEVLIPVSIDGDISNPVTLFSATENTYVLYNTADRGYYFEAI